VNVPTKSIVWIASYPKSGNTWVRFLACNLLFGRQETASGLNALAPDVHELLAAGVTAAPQGLVKTHFALSAGLPHHNATKAALYVVRDPADVLVSNFFYSRRSSASSDTSAQAFDGYVEEFIDRRGDPRWAALGMGSWDDNVSSWRDVAAFPVEVLRYEDMLADPLTAARRVAALVRPEAGEREIEAAVGDSSFERMREIEREDIRMQRVGIFYKPYLEASIAAGNRFMRRGVAGDGALRLRPDQRARLYAALGPLTRELGYETA
jgi:hypothetical protein